MRYSYFTMMVLLVLSSAMAQGPVFQAPKKSGIVESGLLTEISGLVASRTQTKVLWAHNDSGDTPRVFALSTSGKHLGIYNLVGAQAIDWEDIAIGPGPVAGESYLYIGDIGDNAQKRSSIVVYRVKEPKVNINQAPVEMNLEGVEKITLHYPDQAHDSEVLMVDPKNSDIYIVTKRDIPSRVYTVKISDKNPAVLTMKYKGDIPWAAVVGGDISPTRDEIIVRGYFNAFIWQRSQRFDLWEEVFSTQPYSIPLEYEPQGEAICFDAKGKGYYTVSENTHQPLYYFARISE